MLLPQWGRLPLHEAAANKAEVGVVEALLKAYPAAAQAKDRVCMHIHTHTDIDSYARTFKQVYGMCVCEFVCVCVSVYIVCMCVCVCVCLPECMYACIFLDSRFLWVYTHTHIHIYTHTCMCVCIDR